MDSHIIYSAPPLQLTVSRRASPAGVSLLEQTIYGTYGPQYSHTGQAHKVQHLTAPYFFDLWHQAQVVGTYCLSERPVQTATGIATGFYGRYLAVGLPHRGQGYGHLLKQQAVQYLERTRPQPQLFYSYVEANNTRSLQISRTAGFEVLGQLEAFAFGRFYPRADPRVMQLPAEARPQLLAQLATAYQGHTLVHFDQVQQEHPYFVLREKGIIVAGVQAHPMQWRIAHMPGLSGWLLLHVLPYLPVLSRLLNPERYAFAALEAVYVQPGHESALFALLESVLAHFGLTSALLMLDVHDPLSTLLHHSGKLGVLQALKQPVYTHVLGKLNGLTLPQLLGTPPRPLYASAFDYT